MASRSTSRRSISGAWYIATLFVVWQVVSWFSFGTLPTTPVLTGGALIIAGGLIVTFWQPA
jgi:small multidrug resistance family-3 protein